MPKILLDYVMPISVITPTAQASTAFLKQACVVAKPKSGQEGNVGNIYECTSMALVAARTDNTNAQQLFNAGMNKVFILLSDDLALATALLTEAGEFYTLLISDDFVDADLVSAQADGTVTITDYADLVSGTDDALSVAGVSFVAQDGAATLGTATFRAATSNDATATSLAAQINGHATAGALVEATVDGAVVTIKAKLAGWAGNEIAVAYTDNDTNVGLTLAGLSGGNLSGGAGIEVGTFEGVIGVSTQDADVAEDFAAVENYSSWLTSSANKAKNMFFAFGSVLANPSSWNNQQFITMPFDDGHDALGEVETLFEDRINFVLADDEFGKRLGLFCVGGKAIVAPYILKNLRIDLQSATLSWISGNQPQYTKANGALLETRLQQDVVDSYISRGWIEDGIVEISLEAENFTAVGDINVAEPKSLWRVLAEMRQTL